MDYKGRRRLLQTIEILRQETDDDHRLSWKDLNDELKAAGVEANEKTILDDLDFLASVQLVTREKGSRNVGLYSLRKHTFDRNELRVLIDVVASARFLTDQESERLIKKLQNLTSRHVAAKLQNQIRLVDRVKTENGNAKYYIDLLHEAIDERRKVAFRYQKYDVHMQLVPYRQGYIYVVEPYALVWNSDHYYVVGIQEGHETFKTFRVDRMSRLDLTEEHYEPQPFEPTQYLNHTFNMYPGPIEPVEIIFDNHLINVVADRFGSHIRTFIEGDNHFRVRIQAAISDGLVRWILTWGRDARVLSPATLVDRIKQEAERLYRLYH